MECHLLYTHTHTARAHFFASSYFCQGGGTGLNCWSLDIVGELFRLLHNHNQNKFPPPAPFCSIDYSSREFSPSILCNSPRVRERLSSTFISSFICGEREAVGAVGGALTSVRFFETGRTVGSDDDAIDVNDVSRRHPVQTRKEDFFPSDRGSVFEWARDRDRRRRSKQQAERNNLETKKYDSRQESGEMSCSFLVALLVRKRFNIFFFSLGLFYCAMTSFRCVRAIFLFPFFVPAGSKKRWGWTSRREISPTQLLIPPQNQERERKTKYLRI